MGYRAQKIEVEGKIKRIKRILLFIGAILLTGLVVFSCFYPPESWKYYFDLPNVSTRKVGEMRLHFIDVGQGDCTLIELPDSQTVFSGRRRWEYADEKDGASLSQRFRYR